jgi:putative transposase
MMSTRIRSYSGSATDLFATAAERKAAKGPKVKDLHAKIGQLAMENDFFGQRARSYRRCERQAMIDRKHRLPVVQQCQILEIARSSVYYVPRPVSAVDLALMRQIDELHLQYPFAGSRMLRDILQLNGVAVGRKHVATLMRRMGIEALYQPPRTTTPHLGHKVFPYLLRSRQVTAQNQAWGMESPTFRCIGALFIWPPSWTWQRGASWPGGYPTP